MRPSERRKSTRQKRKRRKRRSLKAIRKMRSDGRGEEGERDGRPQAEVLQNRWQSDLPGASELSAVRAGRVPRETWRPRVVRPLRLHGIRKEVTRTDYQFAC